MANTSKNGYEIRSDLLGLAKQVVDFNYQAKITEFEYKIRKDGDQIVQEFKAPTLQATDIIDIAKQFNEFVTNGDVVNKAQELAKPFVDAYQDAVKAFYPNLKNGK